ncbi:exodeoxyribonuclease VII small subunit [Weissella cibaria]|uniref:exodeoxyribonuclease VII small subunit n=1 Tax=Weissella cibaria TaxID=137591 RepID=UPI0002191566|nr:exodeoxyribonuclease VII small subunit [Weissella cibaria]APS27081.1 Exodeoxyribonuclease 7 small subunit [Weissella cibaria]APU62478.1 Exodeoxyribonuclease 7 small subunit [Weissella cibaria]APU64630.1 Exodeoxyribonuclease 7 small subunit [Weissella cibaria]ASS51991.1 Exodeoxyribonuclease 7 small subunit [Weissella cibaria]MBA5962031.1 exodeoxyribonuclease VII small subunit [Weissella cibaria]
MAEKTFEENLATLEKIVAQLEKGDVPLEEALKQFEVGVKLSQELQQTLQTAEQSLAKIVNADGTTSDFEPEG